MNHGDNVPLYDTPAPLMAVENDENMIQLEGDYFDDSPEDWMDDLNEECFIVDMETLRDPWIFNV